jgi:hypothetical protein
MGLGPFPTDELSMPASKRIWRCQRRGPLPHRPESLQHSEHDAFLGLHLWSVHLTAQNGHFLAEHEELDVL